LGVKWAIEAQKGGFELWGTAKIVLFFVDKSGICGILIINLFLL
jgi:hypothetical protein